MELVTRQKIAEYLKSDTIIDRLDSSDWTDEAGLVCQKWLRDTPPKRYIFEAMYGELFSSSQRLRVLDIGGGLTGLTPALASQHDYTLVDLLAHDSVDVATEMMRRVGRDFIVETDWHKLAPSQYDVILANDLFPNVDQRLRVFLEQYLPQTTRIKTSLTWYDVPRFYMTKRIDAEEILCVVPWDSVQLSHVLRQFSAMIVRPAFEVLTLQPESPYSNGRQVCLVEFEGQLPRP